VTTALPQLRAQRNLLLADVEGMEEYRKRRTAELSERRETLLQAAAARQAAFEAQKALRDEEALELHSRLAAACVARDERYQVLQQLHKTHGEYALCVLSQRML
jgi:hypothetical protein